MDKDKKAVLVIGAVIVVGIVGWNLYKDYEIQKDCSTRVQYVPATGATEGLFGKASEGEHYMWGAAKFKTKEDAVALCVKRTKEDGE